MLLSAVPAVLREDQSLGLGLLYAARGYLPTPEKVVVVSISRDSAEALGQPSELDRWPRTLHADVVDSLAAAGAEAVAFDVFFVEPKDDDARFAASLARAGNVVLAEPIDQRVVGGSGSGVSGLKESRVLPVDPLAAASLGSAPFVLPTVPFAVDQFWTFGPSGDIPSLPAVALQAFLLRDFDSFRTLLATARPSVRLPAGRAQLVASHDLGAAMRDLRAEFRADPALAADLRDLLARQSDPDSSVDLQALIDLYSGPDSRYLNYYGPARTIRTIPFDRVAAAAAADLDLAGKMVFVGGSDPQQSEQKDVFHSVFSELSGSNLSGVEIGATAFANLLDGRSIVPLSMPAHLLFVLVWGVAVGVFVAGSSTRTAFLVAVLGATGYGAWILWEFSARNSWWPSLVPLAIQLPAALVLGVLLNYADVVRQRERIQIALGRYVPEDVVRRLSEQSAQSTPDRRLLHGACLCTDVESYVTVSESLRPGELAALMDDYFNLLAQVVKQHGGFVVDAAGDTLIAVWAAAGSYADLRLGACRSALAIVAAVDDFNSRRAPRLPTRVGIESGELLLGDVGPQQRVGYRAIGDIVNTATRLEGLNKLLGTRVLVSDATLAGTTELAARDVGSFLLRGKTTAVRVHELLGSDVAARRELVDRFPAALELFANARWPEAARAFAALRNAFPDDGPTAFYAARSAAYEKRPPRSWGGAIIVEAK
ncbi:MAG TPA: adenylate/guanylate cyclase domain-containing protein [Gammaproteobacteria bacterium]|nr:adenylate/guanylate cyclase domain-containing protein [Gammaproteobacteria bacterium]